jgi:hypothetical protein
MAPIELHRRLLAEHAFEVWALRTSLWCTSRS